MEKASPRWLVGVSHASSAACARISRPVVLRPRRQDPTMRYIALASQNDSGSKYTYNKTFNDDQYIKVRAEAEAPFRTLRLVLFGFFTVSAGAATLFSLPQIIGTLGGAANAKSVSDLVQDVCINVGSFGLCAFLTKRELDGRSKQMERILREERLGQCQLELSTGKLVKMSALRGFSRCILIAGTPQHVQTCIEAAEPFKEKLLERGVTLVPLPIFGEPVEGVPEEPNKEDDKRWRVKAMRLGEWKGWMLDQMATAGRTEEEGAQRGLYIGLRLDGRVRASGMGVPPYARFAAELAPVEGAGAWGGLLDGFDGRVSMFQ